MRPRLHAEGTCTCRGVVANFRRIHERDMGHMGHMLAAARGFASRSHLHLTSERFLQAPTNISTSFSLQKKKACLFLALAPRDQRLYRLHNSRSPWLRRSSGDTDQSLDRAEAIQCLRDAETPIDPRNRQRECLWCTLRGERCRLQSRCRRRNRKPAKRYSHFPNPVCTCLLFGQSRVSDHPDLSATCDYLDCHPFGYCDEKIDVSDPFWKFAMLPPCPRIDAGEGKIDPIAPTDTVSTSSWSRSRGNKPGPLSFRYFSCMLYVSLGQRDFQGFAPGKLVVRPPCRLCLSPAPRDKIGSFVTRDIVD